MHSRRKFLGITGGALVSGALSTYATPLETRSEAGYQLLVMATNWGFPGTAKEFCLKAKQAGYDGIEVWFPTDVTARQEMMAAAKDQSLQVAFLFGGSDKDPKKHLSEFKQAIETAVALKPVYINCHSGRDFFSFEDNRPFIDWITQLSKSTQIPMYHETHRGRILYSASVGRQFMEKIPELRLTLDVSHWCNVHESLLEDQGETMALTLEITDHIHARIGHAEGPQVNDPRAPEWKRASDAHFAWWDKVVATKKREGRRMTFLTEFGPVDYMPALPYTRQPMANQWEINTFMLDVLRKRYV